MNTLFIIYTFVALVCLFQIIILTCEATRQKRQIEELQDKCEYLSKQVESLIKIANKSSEIDHLVKDRLDNVKDRFDNISDTLDLYKRLVDSLNDGQAQLNFRVQQLEADRTRLNNLEWHVTNLNALHKVEIYPTSTDKYDPLNPSGVMYDTQVITNKPETINFTE